MKLYELSTQYAQVVDMLEAAQTGETDALDAEMLKDTLDAIGEAIEAKADNIARIMHELSTVEEAIKAEVERLQGRAGIIKKQRESLKTYLQSAMESTGKDKFKTSFYSFTIKNGNPSVQILDESLIPAELIRTKVETAPDKKAIAELLKAKQEVAGCTLIQSRSLVIR
jgi:hypothetical protein